MMRGVVVLVGPTAVGKSRLALSLAQQLRGEIINADSRQVYRYMDIGTAKPTPRERATVPHHLIDIVNPDADFSLALYQRQAYQAIAEVAGRGRLPLLVGGSGLYIWAVVEGWRLPPVPPNPELRRRLEEQARQQGALSLYQQLRELDPVAAQRLDPRNLRRVIRALEVCHSGVAFSRLGGKHPPPFPTRLIGLTAARQQLYQRIDSRVEGMIEMGLVAEVAALLDKGYSLSLPSMSGVGYRQIGQYLAGQMSLEAAVQAMKFHTHRFARHQYAWFHLTDPRIHWLDINNKAAEKAAALIIKEWLENEVHQDAGNRKRLHPY